VLVRPPINLDRLTVPRLTIVIYTCAHRGPRHRTTSLRVTLLKCSVNDAKTMGLSLQFLGTTGLPTYWLYHKAVRLRAECMWCPLSSSRWPCPAMNIGCIDYCSTCTICICMGYYQPLAWLWHWPVHVSSRPADLQSSVGLRSWLAG